MAAAAGALKTEGLSPCGGTLLVEVVVFSYYSSGVVVGQIFRAGLQNSLGKVTLRCAARAIVDMRQRVDTVHGCTCKPNRCVFTFVSVMVPP